MLSILTKSASSVRGWLDPGVIGPYKTMHVQLRFMLIKSAYSRLVTKHSTTEKSSDIYTWNQTKLLKATQTSVCSATPSLPTPPSIIRPTPGYPELNALAKVWANFFSQFWKKDSKETAVWNVYVLLCFTLYSRANSKYKPPGGLIFGGAI